MRNLLLYLILSVSLAQAQAWHEQAFPQQALPEAASQGGVLSTARERTAYTYLVASTVIPFAAGLGLALSSDNRFLAGTGGVLMLGGILVGPSAGEFYAGAYGRGALGISLRTLGGVVLVAGALTGIGSCIDKDPCTDDHSGRPAVALGSILLLGATAFSVIDTHYAALPNEEHASRIGLTPTLALGGGLRPGLAAWARF